MSIFDRIRQTHKPVSHPKAVHGLFGYLVWSSVSPLGSGRSIEFKVKAGMRRKAWGERWDNKGNFPLIPVSPLCPVL